MGAEFVFLSTLPFLIGITQKLADGHHEHGLNFFLGAGVANLFSFPRCLSSSASRSSFAS